MTRATIPALRKHLYFYMLLILGTLLLTSARSANQDKGPENTRAAAVNKFANILFR